MANKFQQMLGEGKVFRGAYNTTAGSPGIEPHMGAYDPGTDHMHFDPDFLDKANAGDSYWQRDLANDALHESAHALGYNHTDPFNTGVGPIYAESPFNLLSPGTNSCLMWN
jgi:hypothetical protein